MLFGMWCTSVDPSRWPDYMRFEQEYSAPMFRQQPRCLGILFVRLSATEAAARTIWDSQTSIDRLATDSCYRQTVARLGSSGFLAGTRQVDIMPIAHAWFAADVVAVACTLLPP